MQAETASYEFLLDNLYFAEIDSPEVQRGRIHVSLTVKRSSHAFELDFHFKGTVVVPCDRCLDDMDLPIDTGTRLVVKLGKEYSDLGDNLIVIPEEEGELNVAWIMFEFIALAIPMKHVHAPGCCNKAMSRKLREHLRYSPDDGEGDEEDDSLLGSDVAGGFSREEDDPASASAYGFSPEEEGDSATDSFGGYAEEQEEADADAAAPFALEEGDPALDSRWNELKKLIDNN